MIQFLHVGMPKAASTWLQEAFFAHHPQLAVLGVRAGAGEVHARFTQEVRRLVRGGDLSADVGEFQQAVEGLARERQAQRRAVGAAADVVGVSSEVLAGDWPAGRNTRFLADALARCWPEAKVLLVVREQRRMIESSFQEYVRQGGTESFGAFLFGLGVSRGTVHDREVRRSHVLEYFKFAPKVELYRERFGRDNVHVACMEQLVAAPDAFAAGIAAFLGVEAHTPPPQRTNPQLSGAALGVLRKLNHWFATDHHPRFGWMPINALLTATIARRWAGWEEARANPWWLGQRVSAHVQHRLAEGLLPVADRWLLRHVPTRKRHFSRLATPLREFAEQQYRRDNDVLRELVPWDLAEMGYLVSPSTGSAHNTATPE